MNLFVIPFKTFQDILELKKRSDITGNVLLCRSNEKLCECAVEGKVTNIAFRVAYLLWNLRGANILESLNYYSDHLKGKSDDDISLRGAYGPRIRNWIGADQLQEAISKNLDVDDPKDMIKPKGIDQLEAVYNDMMNGFYVSNLMIFNPSIDFDNSNDIPDLLNIIFYKENEKLNMNIIYATVEIDGNFVNDYFLLNIIHHMMAKILKIEVGMIKFIMTRVKFVGNDLVTFLPSNENILYPSDVEPKGLWSNLFFLYGFEKHLRCNITKDGIEHPDVDMKFVCDKMIEKFLDKITCPFWKELGYILMFWALRKYDLKNKYVEYRTNVLKQNLVSRLGLEVL